MKRGECPVCHRSITLRSDGAIRGHGRGLHDPLEMWCAGSWTTPNGEPRPIELRRRRQRGKHDWFEDVRGDLLL